MKSVSSLVFFLILVFASTSFSQTQSQIETFNKFWDFAKNNNFESAKTQLEPTLLASENIGKMKQNFQLVSIQEIKLLEFRLQNISQNRAFFIIATKDKNGQQGNFRMTMSKMNETWKISSFVYEIWVNKDPQGQDFGRSKQMNAQIIPLKPYNAKENPIDFLAKPYKPKENPVNFLNIIPKPK